MQSYFNRKLSEAFELPADEPLPDEDNFGQLDKTGVRIEFQNEKPVAIHPDGRMFHTKLDNRTKVNYNGIDIRVDWSYYPPEPRTWEYPGSPGHYETGYVWIDATGEVVEPTDAQQKEIDELVEQALESEYLRYHG